MTRLTFDFIQQRIKKGVGIEWLSLISGKLEKICWGTFVCLLSLAADNPPNNQKLCVNDWTLNGNERGNHRWELGVFCPKEGEDDVVKTQKGFFHGRKKISLDSETLNGSEYFSRLTGKTLKITWLGWVLWALSSFSFYKHKKIPVKTLKNFSSLLTQSSRSLSKIKYSSMLDAFSPLPLNETWMWNNQNHLYDLRL